MHARDAGLRSGAPSLSPPGSLPGLGIVVPRAHSSDNFSERELRVIRSRSPTMALAPLLSDTLEKRLALEDTNSHTVIVARDDRRYVLLRRTTDGRYLSSSSLSNFGGQPEARRQDGSETLRCVDMVDDSAVWSAIVGGFRHPISGAIVEVVGASSSGLNARPQVNLQLPDSTGGSLVVVEFLVEYGPESLPSEYLETLQDQGIVCMPSLLAPALVEELQELAATQVAAEDAGVEGVAPLVLRSIAAARCCVNPVALFVIRSYMKTDDVMQAHYPGFAVLRPNDGTGIQGAEGPGGWHRCAGFSPPNYNLDTCKGII